MQNPLEIEIKRLLRKQQSKKEIFAALSTEENKDTLEHMLNNLPTCKRNNKMLPLRIVVIILLILLTVKQFLFVYLHEASSVDLMLGLIGPLIHIYILREILRNHRLGYQVLPLLSILALLRPENRIVPDIYMYITMALFSGLLFLFLFPKKEKITY